MQGHVYSTRIADTIHYEIWGGYLVLGNRLLRRIFGIWVTLTQVIDIDL